MRAWEFITESITDTPQFKKWFRNSVVVDANGKPMVVYHGSKTSQDLSDRGFSPGEVHFGTVGHAGDRAMNRGVSSGSGTFPVYLSIQNPKRVEDEGVWSAAYLNKIKSEGYDGVVYLNRWEGIAGKENSFDDDMYTDEEFLQAHPEARDSYIVFHPAQIKSAIGNNGKFDPKNPDITKEDRELWQTMQYIIEHGESLGLFVDGFHGGNVLQRNDGTPVIMDPYYYRGNLE